jgi:predicted ATPase/class 3 adenylate cyclase/DNA-binding CsgD family transcriptional regulator
MHELPTGTITLLFTDIEGSTRLLQHLGERYADVLAECRVLMRTAFNQHHGHEVDIQGDAFFVTFARASDAVAAAVAAQHALASYSWPDGVKVLVRMGLHTGEPQRSAEGYVGLDVHHAARIMSAGHGGQVLLSQTTRDLVEHALPEGVHLQDLGAYRLKDLQQANHLFQLVIPGLPIDFPPLKTLDSYPNNLPLQPTPFLGREKEVGSLQQLLLRESSRLVTLTGPGGVGKTRLALQVAAELAEHYTDGTWFVSLAPISDPDLVIPTINRALGLQETREQTPLEQVKRALQEKRTLLLLDNFEQVGAAATSVADLLTCCPRLKVLVTSREVLHLRAEHAYAVPPLTLPDPTHLPDLLSLSQYDAVALFIERAQAVKSDFQVSNSTAPAVAEICVRLDGLPLALELAAARLRLFPPQALLARLGQRLPLLVSRTRDAPARQHTLRNTIAWSYDLLEASEQRLFRRVCVFVGGMTLEAVEAVCAAQGDEPAVVLDGLASLMDKSLLRQSEPEGEQSRFVMLETIREYGWEALSESLEAEATRQAHAAYFVALAEEAAPELFGPRMAEWLRRLELEHDNLRAAMNWLLERGETAMALRMGAALYFFWELNYAIQEGWNALSQALVGSEDVAVPVRAQALGAAGYLANLLGHFERGEDLGKASVALFRMIGDTVGMGEAVYRLARNAYERGEVVAARSRFEESIELNREAGNKTLIGWSLFFLAFADLWQGEYAGIRACLEESLALFRAMGDPFGTAFSLHGLANYAFIWPGDLPPAQMQAMAEESLALFRDIGARQYEAVALRTLGEITFFLAGDTTTAHQLLEQSCRLFREMGYETQLAWTLSLLGQVLAAGGDLGAARAVCEESLMLEMRVNTGQSIFHYALILEGLAAVVAAQGEAAWAARLLGRAEAQRETIKTPLLPIDRVVYDHAVALARSHLDEPSFAAAWAQGRAMTLEQVFAARGPVTIPDPLPTSQPAAPSLEQSVPSYPEGLTAREGEVLRLVAQGFTSAQIAEHLLIGLATVNFHVRSIYSKLGVSSRSAATRYAIEHGFI